MTNDQIADVLDQVADLLEFESANPFRIRAYRSGSRVVRELAESVSAIVEDATRELTELPGIGKDLAEKIMHYDKNADAEYKAHMFLMNRIQDRTIL